MIRWIFLLAMLLATGCQAPVLVFPGGKLEATPAHTDSFALADNYRLLKLEVNPEDPYSIILRTTVIDGALYIDAAPARRWARYLTADRRVRVQLGEKIYEAIARVVTEPAITDRFLPGRTVYRIEPVEQPAGD